MFHKAKPPFPSGFPPKGEKLEAGILLINSSNHKCISLSLPLGGAGGGFYGTSIVFRISVMISSVVILLASAS